MKAFILSVLALAAPALAQFGGFGAFASYGPGANPRGIAAADFDADGDNDLAVVADGSDKVEFYRNNGNGTFANGVALPVGNQPHSIVAADLDRDGDNDLAVTNYDSTFFTAPISILLNNGDGTFPPGTVTVVGQCGQGSIDAIDFDHDGDRDVVLTEEQGCPSIPRPRIFLAENDGQGRFTLLPPIIVDTFAVGITAADLNFDGHLDLVTVQRGGIAVFRGNGDLTFQAPLITSTAVGRMALADLNRDGYLDAVGLVTQGSFGTVYIGVALGNGDGTFRPVTQYSGSSVLESGFRISNDVEIADVNRDGRLDVVVSNNASNDISLFLGNGDGTLGRHQRYGAGYAAHRSARARLVRRRGARDRHHP